MYQRSNGTQSPITAPAKVAWAIEGFSISVNQTHVQKATTP
jgi:hypothetical protein